MLARGDGTLRQCWEARTVWPSIRGPGFHCWPRTHGHENRKPTSTQQRAHEPSWHYSQGSKRSHTGVHQVTHGGRHPAKRPPVLRLLKSPRVQCCDHLGNGQLKLRGNDVTRQGVDRASRAGQEEARPFALDLALPDCSAQSLLKERRRTVPGPASWAEPVSC